MNDLGVLNFYNGYGQKQCNNSPIPASLDY